MGKAIAGEGARIGILDLDREAVEGVADEFGQRGAVVVPVEADTSELADVDRAVAAMPAAFGKIDVRGPSSSSGSRARC